MTLPIERNHAVIRAEQFLKDLMDPKKTPGIPKEIRERAYRCLKHYPTEYDMAVAMMEAPTVFGDWQQKGLPKWKPDEDIL